MSGAAGAGVTGSVAAAIAAGAALHTFGSVDAVHQMLSDTVSTPAGAALLGLACAALVAAAGFLTAAARHAPRPGPVRVLLGLWAAGLVALAVFPTNLPGTEVTTSTVVHRWGAALAVAVPPIVALLVAPSRRLRTAALVAGGMAAVYGLAHLPALVTGAAVLPYAGLGERLLLAADLLVVVLTGAHLGPRSARAEPAGRQRTEGRLGRRRQAFQPRRDVAVEVE